ncbi:hypothetical protein GCM10020221_12360 [Streptomyces thioluteus]|uniref:Uncharacterized protein n=1 Tax=Streptomyces thioluteus TaxID=66431 RepID=A0ABN3WKH6_STRTU
MVEAAKTTAYWRRKVPLVKSTLLVLRTASESFWMIQVAASAQPLARAAAGSRAAVGSGGVLEVEWPGDWQYSWAGPRIRSHGSLPRGGRLPLGTGDGLPPGDGVPEPPR